MHNRTSSIIVLRFSFLSAFLRVFCLFWYFFVEERLEYEFREAECFTRSNYRVRARCDSRKDIAEGIAMMLCSEQSSQCRQLTGRSSYVRIFGRGGFRHCVLIFCYGGFVLSIYVGGSGARYTRCNIFAFNGFIFF